ncbi:hypothetical protein EGC79_04100 [Shewanella vesiculosa]|uniref:hypothetical protein n=1 Tax=Shewanella vesiculosa TaxID=518738 RepID=UPI000F4E9591|nr:hypothetical protein [Shewanella vesiculosa]RPA55646.1 hypothetical protein EGC79_04100 [Shewanella vesiculosa]UJL41347.1 hypothetical protein KDH10_002296 [Shewanella vesiculosa]
MANLFTNVLATIILLSGMFLMVLIMHLMLKYRDHTVKLPVDREQLQRIPAYGLQRISFKASQLHFPLWLQSKAIAQATRQAILAAQRVSHWLTKAVGQTIASASPLLAFPGWYVSSHNFQQPNAATVPVICNKELNHKQLVKTIPAVRTQALNQQIDAIVYQAAQRCLNNSEIGK